MRNLITEIVSVVREKYLLLTGQMLILIGFLLPVAIEFQIALSRSEPLMPNRFIIQYGTLLLVAPGVYLVALWLIKELLSDHISLLWVNKVYIFTTAFLLPIIDIRIGMSNEFPAKLVTAVVILHILPGIFVYAHNHKPIMSIRQQQ